MANRALDALIDSHCHLNFSCFDPDRPQIIEQCGELGIDTFVVPGTQQADWIPLIQLAATYPQIHFALGLHPYFLDTYQDSDIPRLEQLIVKHREQVVAVGEIGLDGAIDVDWSQQLQVFDQQLSLATKYRLPVILHHRKSHNDLIRLLKQYDFSQGGIIHAYSGSYQQASAYLDLGFKLGVGGGITYSRANKTRNTFAKVPLSALVLETDSPDMPISGKQGIRNTPLTLLNILDALTEIRSETRQELVQGLTQNTRQVLANF
jgi:TatD DNase family protein